MSTAATNQLKEAPQGSDQVQQVPPAAPRLTLDEIIKRARLERSEGTAQERVATALRAISW